MTDNKALRVLHTFSPVEFRQWLGFVRSGYFTKDRYILRLLDVLQPLFPDFNSDLLQALPIYRAVYPDLPFDMPRLRRLFSDLTLLIEQFMANQQLEQDKLTQLRLLKRAYQTRGLDKDYEHLLVLESKELATEPKQDAEHLYQQYLHTNHQYQYLSGKQNRSMQLNPSQLLDGLDAFYLAAKLRICCEVVNRANILNTSFDKPMVDGLLASLAQSPHREVPSIALYHSVLLTLVEPDVVAHYQHLKQQLPHIAQLFDKNELKDIYALAQNYCIRKVNTGHSIFLRELFELYHLLLQNGLLTEDGHLSPQHYKNIVFVALRLDEVAWCRQFIEDYRNALPPNHQNDAYYYNLAYWHYFKKDYAKTLQLLNRIGFTDVFYFLDSRSLLLKTYYELDEIDALLGLMDTFRSNLQRNKQISTYQKTIYLNLVKVVKKLARLHPSNKAQFQKLKQFVETNRQIADRNWVLGKLNEMA
jgi:hypothetical protein